jgi:hypothetical protein
VIEAPRRGERQECIPRHGAHRREIGEVDRQQALRQAGGVEAGKEVDACHLAVHRDREGTPGRKDRRVVANQRMIKPPSQPAQQLIFALAFHVGIAAGGND